MLKWFVRRGFWNVIAWGKYKMNKPLEIPMPPAERHVIEPKPMIEVIPEVLGSSLVALDSTGTERA